MPDHDTSATPKHYTSHKVTPIDLIADYQLNFNLGCAIKHIARSGEKLGTEDLYKAIFYLIHELGIPTKECVEEINGLKSAVAFAKAASMPEGDPTRDKV